MRRCLPALAESLNLAREIIMSGGKKREKKLGPIFTEREMWSSKAWWALSGTAIKVLGVFLCKRRIAYVTVGKKREPKIANNGEIVGIAVLVDRTKEGIDFGFPLYQCLKAVTPAYKPDECPLCAAGIPLTRPGGH